MGVHSRNSNDYLHTEVILSKITEYDIFKHYCPNFKQVGVKFKSDLRPDNSPTVSIAKINNRLLYKDFGNPNHTFNCFSYVMYKYSLSFMDCLKTISNDFGLNLISKVGNVPKAVTYGLNEFEGIKEKALSKIKVKTRPWTVEDKNFWIQFGVSKELLLTFGVSPIDYFWINNARFKCKTITYVFNFKEGVKIYSPLETDYKWHSNVSIDCIQGYSQLSKGEIVILTSSLKDIMTLRVLGYQAVALQSEMHFPSEKLIEDLASRFKNIVVFYDNDADKPVNNGQIMANKICEKYKLFNLCIPAEYKSKDISDFVKNHGLKKASNLLKTMLHGITIFYKP